MPDYVAAWAKNDHLGFEITYSHKGIIRKFRPDYLVRLSSGKMLVLEVKGQDTQEQQTKREFLAEWVERKVYFYRVDVGTDEGGRPAIFDPVPVFQHISRLPFTWEVQHVTAQSTGLGTISYQYDALGGPGHGRGQGRAEGSAVRGRAQGERLLCLRVRLRGRLGAPRPGREDPRYLQNIRRVGAFGHVCTDEVVEVFRAAGAIHEGAVRGAEEVLIVRRIKEMLLE